MITVFLSLSLLLVVAVQAQDSNRAALVVRFSDERVEQRCVSFTEEEITGLELLERSGLAFETLSSGLGANVCRVDDVGCGTDNCFCQCQGADCVYWSYWRLQEDGWRYSGTGVHATVVTNGTVEGWSWGPGSVNQAISPPQVTFEEVCTDGGEESTAGEVDTMAEGTPTVEVAAVTPAGVAEVAPTVTAEPASEPAAENSQSSGPSYLLFGAIAAGLFVALLLARLVRRP